MLDRDGVLNKKPPRAHYVRNWNEFEWLPGAKEALRLLKENGYRVIIVSNQAGIGRGAMTETDLCDIHERMTAGSGRSRVVISTRFTIADTIGTHGCECRKPKPGLLFRAQRELNLDLSRTPFIGDDERDAAAAEAAGCPFVLVSDELSLLGVAQRLINVISLET